MLCSCFAALDRHLTIPIQGKLTQSDLFTALVGMAAMNQSVHSITSILDQVPCETSFRYHLKKLDRDELERNNTAILTSLSENEPYIVRRDAKSRQMSFIPTSPST